jgi:hypothetical protein
MSPDTVGTIVILVGLAATGLYIHFLVTRSKYLLNKWATDNHFQLLHAEHRMFRKGPFLWSSRQQVVYRVRVRDDQSREREGWVRVGGWWIGVFSDKVEAEMDG